MADTLLLPLRILYNLNRSPQYILARSNKKYPVSVVPQHHAPLFYYASTSPLQKMGESARRKDPEDCIYASASLKACLDTICWTSPELMQNPSCDYSVYVLDPLESQPVAGPVNVPADATNGTGTGQSDAVIQPQPVAVGLGLMSWALLADEHESTMVNGTVLKLSTGEQVLQVIFALRDAVPIQKAALPEALRSWGLPPLPSKRSQVHASRPHHSSTSKFGKSSSQSRDSNSRLSPEHAKQNARPFIQQAAVTSALTQTSHAERILDSADVYVGPPRRKAGRPGKSSQSSDTAASIAGPTSSNPANPCSVIPPLYSLTTSVENSSANVLGNLSSAQNSALISVLSAIDGDNKGLPNPALVDALKQLLSTCPQPEANPSPATSTALRQTNNTKSPSDDDIIILDQENVNPTAFRRRVDREDTKLSGPEVMRTGAPLGNKQNSLSALSSSASNALRKRTLSEFMSEREREHTAGRHKARGRADVPPHASNYSSPGFRKSMPHHSTQDENAIPNIVSGPATSPVRPLRRQGLPEWAKTTTATQPRFSKETQEYMNKKAAETKHRKKKERRTAGTHVNTVGRVSPGSSKSSTSNPPEEIRRANRSVDAFHAGPRDAPSPMHPPIFASDLILPPSSPPPPSSPVQSLPQTPVHQNIQHDPSAYNIMLEEHSLFTPTPGSCLSNLRNNTPTSCNSPLSSPSVSAGRADKAARRLEKSRMMGELDADRSASDIINDDARSYSTEAEFPNDENNPSMFFDDLGHLFADEAGDLADIFAQISDGSVRQQDNQGELLLPSGDAVVEFDFTEFWQSVKPLMDTRAEGQTDWMADPSRESGDALGDIDHTKLAADVQALFSGCLM